MLPRLKSPFARAAAYVAVLACGWVVVFVLPWHATLGRPAPAVSDSYVIGFDNRIAILGVFMTALGLAAVSVLSGARKPSEASEPFLAQAPPAGERLDRRLTAALLAATGLAGAAFVAITTGTIAYGEKPYFLDRMAYLLAGNAPFRDMEYTYGLLLAYWPVAVYRVLAPLGASPEFAYGVSWLIADLAGVFVLVYVVNRLGIDRRLRGWLLVGLGASLWLNETVGLNEIVLRFTIPVAAVLFLHGRAARLDTESDARAPLKLYGWAAAGCAVCFALSPEMGLATLAAAAVYTTAFARRAGKRFLAAPALLLLLTPIAVVALVGLGLFRHLVAMAGGALNFPVVPGPPVLVLLAAMLAAAALLPRALAAGGRAQAPVVLAMTTLAAALAVGALGRADITHTGLYGLAALFLAVPLVAATSRRAALALFAVFAAASLAGHALNVQGLYATQIARAAATSPAVPDSAFRALAAITGQNSADASALRAELRALPTAPLSAFDTRSPVAAPLGFVDDLGLRLALSGRLASVYFRGIVFTVDQARSEVGYLARARFAVVPSGEAATIYATAPPSPAATGTPVPPRPAAPPPIRRNYWVLLMWPESFPQRRQPVAPRDLIRQTLARDFRPIGEAGRYTILARVRG